MEILEDLQPAFTVITAVLSLAVLGFILKLSKAARDNAKDLIAIKDERLVLANEDARRAKEWAEKEKEDLIAQLESAKNKANEILKSEGLTIDSLAIGERLTDSANELGATLEQLATEMKDKLEALSEYKQSYLSHESNSINRTIAMADMAAGKYEEAALAFGKYSNSSIDWKEHLSRGVAYANARAGDNANLLALRAYNDTLAYAPREGDQNMIARVFTYRGAILKRLGRYGEAISDLSMALKLASKQQEILDTNYNLACVYALQGEKENMQKHLKEIKSSPRYSSAVSNHFHDYFGKFKDDPVLLEVIR